MKNEKDKRKEKERCVNSAMEEIHAKGYTKERGEEYQRRQIEWWKECDKSYCIGESWVELGNDG